MGRGGENGEWRMENGRGAEAPQRKQRAEAPLWGDGVADRRHGDLDVWPSVSWEVEGSGGRRGVPTEPPAPFAFSRKRAA